ncbi:unnamed protein product [Lactuca virosa]|uniref:Uncharacterized protein n=1 Tax=Lactuca virosa TaxID=75947 RepID=A0AAU9MBD2_9ASTR|nr:unnamed protein product [Lactuca virosa]
MKSIFEENVMPEPQSNMKVIGVMYLKVVGEKTITQEGVKSKCLLVRYKDIPRILGDTAVMIHRLSYLQLLGSAEEVEVAEMLLVDAVTKAYDEKEFVPTALMPPSICHHTMTIPVMKDVPLMGFNGSNLLKMESQTGAWIELDTLCDSVLVINIYGQELKLTNAIKIIKEQISEYEESVKLKHKLDEEDSVASEIASTRILKRKGFGCVLSLGLLSAVFHEMTSHSPPVSAVESSHFGNITCPTFTSAGPSATWSCIRCLKGSDCGFCASQTDKIIQSFQNLQKNTFEEQNYNQFRDIPIKILRCLWWNRFYIKLDFKSYRCSIILIVN